MAITVSTAVFREGAVRASHIANGCRWWTVQARALVSEQHAHPLDAAVAKVSAVAERAERLAHELSALAQNYDDHEAHSGRILEVMSAGALVAVLGPWLPLGALGLEALIAAGVICRDGPTRVAQTLRLETSAPDGVDALLARVPQGDDQIRIDTVERAGTIAYVVYVSGTRDFSPVATVQPFDLTSGFHSLRGDAESGCERAVREAMRDAGINRGDRVVFVGHSLGGLTAMRIAQSGDFDVSDVLSVGAPIHGIQLDDSTRLTMIEHTDDLVPAASGVAVVSTAVTVRSAFGQSTSGLWGAHDMRSYRATAREIDSSSDQVLRSRRASLVQATAGERVTSRWYRARRN